MTMAEKVQKYRCTICGAIVIPNPDGSCPVCGAPKEALIPVDDDGNDIEQ
jgi:rubrerythrin